MNRREQYLVDDEGAHTEGHADKPLVPRQSHQGTVKSFAANLRSERERETKERSHNMPTIITSL
jgi:hypothetical protein